MSVMGFGNLDREIEIQIPQESVGSNGERTYGWSEYVTLWAGLGYGPGDEKYEASQLTASNTIDFKIRYYTGITTDMRISYGNAYYDIRHIEEVDRQRYLILKAEKKT